MGTHRLIYIRADANSQIASGHLMRCLSVAWACKSIGLEICFLVSAGESAALLKSFLPSQDSFPIRPLQNAAYDNLEQELGEVAEILGSRKEKPVYLLDSYYVTKEYLAAVSALARVAYLDDLKLFDYPVDLLINYDVISEKALPAYQAAYQNCARRLLGAAYAPLRPQFQNKPVPVNKNAQNLLITTGGSDPCHFCVRFLHLVMDEPSAWPFSKESLRIHMVIGKLNTDREPLFRLAGKLPFLKLYENVSDMASLMQTCDLAVSAAGTTLYELCALGIPSVSFALADNQIDAAKAFDEAGAIPWAGDIRTAPEKVMDAIRTFVTSMSLPEAYLARLSAHKAMRGLVDGNGALRIAEALREMLR